MKSKFWKVAWMVWSLLMLSIGNSFAATVSGTSGGTNWSFDSETKCLTISPGNEVKQQGQVLYKKGEMGNYAGTWSYPCGDSTLYGVKGTMKDPCPGNYTGKPGWYNATYSYSYRDRWGIQRTRTEYVRENIECLIVEEGVTKLGAASFYNLSNLKSVQLPNSLEEIGYEAFRLCVRLDSIHIGPNVCTIRDRWATDCTVLETIDIDPNNQCYFVDKYGAVYNSDQTILVKVPQALNIDELTIPEGVTKFATDALYQNKNMVSLVLPSTMDTVDYGALDGMSALKKIYFNSVEAPYFQKTIGNGTNTQNMIIYIPCIPSETFDERETEYGKQTGIPTGRIESFLNSYQVEAVSENPKKGTAAVTTRMDCENTTTTITATPNSGYNFLYWESDKSSQRITERVYSFECTESIVWTAYFSSNSYVVTVTSNIGEDATTTGSGIYEIDSNAEISATTSIDCYSFERWDDGNTDNPRIITVGSSAKTYTAIFSKGELNATASANNSAWGSASIMKNGASLSGSALCGDTLTFSAEAKEHAHFLMWENGETASSFDTIVYDNMSIKAIFALDSFLITFKDYDDTELQSKLYAYGVTPSCEQPSREATAEYTYTFKGWTPAVTNVSGDATYKAEYDSTANSYNFITDVDGKQTSSKKAFDTSVEEPAAPAAKTGYTFQYWMDKDSAQVDFPFNMPANDTTVYANYKVNAYALKVYDMDKETLLTDTLINYGSAVEMPAAPAHEGYKFKAWSERINTMPAENKDIYALYDTLEYNVTFTDRNNEVITKLTVKYNKAVDAIQNPTEEGYTFQYWKNETNEMVEFPFNMPAKDTTILSQWTINNHIVVYIKDNGEKNDTVQYDYNKVVAAPAVPTKTGYTFSQWNTENGEKQDFSFRMPDNKVVLTAQYDINSYNFIVSIDGEKTSTAYEYNAAVTMPESPVKEGYTFTGWSDSISVMPDHDVTTTAQWKINNYQLTYFLEAGANEPLYGPFSVEYNSTIAVQEDPKKEGHIFQGWEVTGQNDNVVPAKMPAYDLDIVATWVVDTFNYNVNVDGEITTTRRFFGETFEMPASVQKDCYTFAGWSDSTTTMPSHDVTTIAQWKINNHTLTFLDEDKETILKQQSIGCGGDITGAPTATKEGFNFAGWTSENNEPTQVPAIMPDEDVTLVASYERASFVITFLNLGGDTVKCDTLPYEAPIVKPADPTYETYTFESWTPDVPETVPAKNMTFTAVYDMEKYNVTFYDMDGTTVLYSAEMNSAAHVQPYLDVPAHEGHHFSHWVNKYDADVLFPVTMTSQDTAFYAIYEKNVYQIIFYDNADFITEYEEFEYGESLEDYETPALEDYGYSCSWINAETGTTELPATMPAHDIKMYKDCTPNPHTVTFVKNNGEENKVVAYNYGSTVTDIDHPTKECNTFAGWVDDLDDEVALPFTLDDEDVTLYASFTQNKHNLIFKYDEKDEEVVDAIEIGCGDAVKDFTEYVSLAKDSTGYEFTGWASTPEIIGGVMPDQDVLVVAQYAKKTFFVATVCGYPYSGNNLIPEEDKAYFEYQAPITVPDSISKEGFTFKGWKIVKSNEYLEDGMAMPATNLIVECDYDVNYYTVTFLDYNEEILKQQTKMYNDTFSAPAVPEREGYNFIGWDKEVPANVPAKNIVFTAQYEKQIHTVAFFANDNEKEPVKAVTAEFGSPVVAPTPSTHTALVREGWTFAGWDKEVPATIPAEDEELFAQWTRNSHELTIMYSQDSLIRQTIKAYDDTINAPADPERKGYTFTGWKEEIPSNMPDRDVYSVAQFKINQYEVRFYDYDSVFIKGSKGDYGSSVKAPVAGPRKGYTFVGWNKPVPETIEENDTLYAQYTVNSYDVTFLDWNSEVISSYTDTFGAGIVVPNNPIRTGYQFAGWSPEVPETIGAGHMTFIAQYEIQSFDITYYDYDSTTVIKKNTVEYNAAAPTVKAPTRDGYTFTGWDPEVPANMPDSNVVVYATYKVKSYIVTYQNDNGKVLERDTFDFGAPVTVTNLIPEKEGNKFTGWTPALPETMPKENVTVKATYEKLKYVLSFRYEDSKKNIKTSTVLFGANIVAPEIPEREGYDIIGWDREIPATMPAHNDTFFAQYKVNQYMVTYKDKETDVNYFSELMDFDTEIPSIENPTKKGYTFVDWDATITKVPSYNITVYAIWEANPYVIYYRDWNKDTIQTDTVKCNAPIIPMAVPQREGYTFTGWSPILPEVMPAKNVTVTAQYEKNKYEIIFRDEEGNIIAKDSLDFGDPIVPPADPEKEGYDFEGWEPQIPETVPAEDIDVRPIFTRASYVITFEDFDGSVIDSDTLAFEARVKKPNDPTRTGYTFAGWEPTVPTKMPGNNLTCVAQYEKNQHVIIIVDDEGNELLNDTLDFGDPIVPPTDPKKDGYTFDGWEPQIPEFMPDSDIYTRPTWTEDTLIIEEGSVKAISDEFANSDKFCAGHEAAIEFKLVSGLARTFEVTFSKEAVAAGFKKSVTGSVDEDGKVYFEIPSDIEEGTYKATLQLFGETQESAKVDFTFSLNPNSRYISRMWDDVVVCDNSDNEFVAYQWYKNGEEIVGADKQFYCDLGGLEGEYSVEVTTVDGKKKFICGATFKRILPPFSITAYPNPAKANENFTLEVKGLSEEELEVAKIYVYKVSGTIAHTERKIDYKNLVSLPQGVYVALVVVEGKSASCEIIVR